MSLLNNYTVLNSKPGREIGGFTNLLSNYKPSKWYSFFDADTNETTNPRKQACIPTGTEPPYSWILALQGGEFSSTTKIAGTGALSPTMILTKPLASGLSGVGGLSGSLSLLSSLAAALSGSGSMTSALSLAISLSANLAGTGAVAPNMGLLINMVAEIGGSGQITANLKGVARLEASIFVNQSTATVNEIVAGVWSALASAYNDAGTMGEKLNDAGAAGNPWAALLADNNDPATFGERLQKLLTTGKFLGLK